LLTSQLKSDCPAATSYIIIILSVKTDAHLTVALSTPEEFCLSRAIQMFALLLLL